MKINCGEKKWYRYQVTQKPNNGKKIIKTDSSFEEVFAKAMSERDMIVDNDRRRDGLGRTF